MSFEYTGNYLQNRQEFQIYLKPRSCPRSYRPSSWLSASSSPPPAMAPPPVGEHSPNTATTRHNTETTAFLDFFIAKV